MSQYLDSEEQFQMHQNNQDFQSLKTSYYDLDDSVSNNEIYFSNKNDSKQSNQTLENDQQEFNETKNEEYFKEGLYFYQERKKNFIQYSHKTKVKYVQCKKGKSSETCELAINSKTLFIGLIDEAGQKSLVAKKCREQIDNFRNSESNIANFRGLLGVEQINNQQYQEFEYFISKKSDPIRQFCLQHLSKKQTIQKIIKNNKMKFKNKLALIKHLEGLRKACIYPEKFHKWKQC